MGGAGVLNSSFYVSATEYCLRVHLLPCLHINYEQIFIAHRQIYLAEDIYIGRQLAVNVAFSAVITSPVYATKLPDRQVRRKKEKQRNKGRW